MSVMRTFRGEEIPHFKITSHRRVWFAISSVLVIASIVGLFYPGLKLSIDFEGGAVLQMPNPAQATVPEITAIMATADRGDAEVQIVAGNQLAIRTSSLTDLKDERSQLLQQLAETAGITPEDINSQDVGPSWGGQISKKMLQALLIYLVLVAGYIAFRFEPKMAAGALIALFHDVVITAGIYVLFGLEVTPETVIAILTILGFSLYDTVVIYDKIQENKQRSVLKAKMTYAEIVNYSLNQTIMRSVNTSLVVLLPIASLMFLGGETLQAFAFALFIGIGFGAYSSIFLAAPILVVLQGRQSKLHDQSRTAKASAKVAAAAGATAVAMEAGAASGVKGSAVSAPGSSTPRPVMPGTGAPPRPRKKKSTAKKKR